MNRSTMLFLGGVFVLAGCGGDGSVDTSTDELGKTKYHYEPSVSDVTFNAGCGVIEKNQPEADCSYGFSMTYDKDYVDLTTTITHDTSNSAQTIEITVDTWSYSQIHSMIAEGPQTDDLGLLGAKVGEKYKVKVVDRKGHSLWTGSVETLYHM
jgi:hypothetical protein